MLRLSRVLMLSGVVLAVALAALAVRRTEMPAPVPPSATAEGALRITSDTLAYCQHLRAQVNALMRREGGVASAEVMRLRATGQRLCAEGEVRGGVLRLRGAVLLLMHRSPDRP